MFSGWGCPFERFSDEAVRFGWGLDSVIGIDCLDTGSWVVVSGGGVDSIIGISLTVIVNSVEGGIARLGLLVLDLGRILG